MKKLFKKSLLKAVIVTVIFALIHMFYYTEYIRSNVEDIGFDMTNKMMNESSEQELTTPNVMLFAFDNLYMKKEKLINEDNQTDYGYMFPRDKIAQFITELDEVCRHIERENLPKALFIDYDFSFTSQPYGKRVSKEDEILLEVLSKERPYTIFLAKNRTENFIENSNNKRIQTLIERGKIVFVSVLFLTSNDGSTRRYLSYKKYKNSSGEKNYLNVNIALWQYSQKGKIDIVSAEKAFKKSDIIANRFLIKSYKNLYTEDACQIAHSYWRNYVRYSASCSMNGIVEENFSNALIMLGGTFNENNDRFNIEDGKENLTGIELHANVLMTLFSLNGEQIQPLNFWISILLIFLIYLIIDFVVSIFLVSREIRYDKVKVIGFIVKERLDNNTLHFFIVFIVIASIMFLLSIYLLLSKHIWFNWFVPSMVYQTYTMILYMKYKIKTTMKLFNGKKE